ncbi:MAG: chromate transporter [Bacteroidales bacterium]|nr:chromate transporter [Bacteroidales bacterium]
MIFWQLFITFFHIGFFTIGGGYVMIPLIEKEVVDKHKWLDNQTFIDMLALAQSVPGIMAVNTAIFVGYHRKGILGALCCLLGCVLPSFIVILAIAICFSQIKGNQHIEHIFQGIRPAVVALMVYSVWSMIKKIPQKWVNYTIIVVVTLILVFLPISPIWLILVAAFLGLLMGIRQEKH